MLRLRAPIRWWEPVLPAGCWLTGANLILSTLRTMMRARLIDRAMFCAMMRVSGRLSRAGFNSWRFWEGKWK